MKIKLRVTVKPGTEPREVTTNLLVISEWEKSENRKVSDGRGIGVNDFVCWAFHLFKLAGETMPATWAEWLKQNPDMDIEAVDQTNPNPTDAAPTAAN